MSSQIEKIGQHTLIRGDCREILPGLAGFHGCATDPPYHLLSIVKRFGSATAAPAKVGATGAFARSSKGFMGQEWDGGDVAFQAETWAHVWRALRPGGHLAAFSADRTYHRMAVAIEDAGFEVRNMFAWMYGTGMPKSHKVPGYDGWGTMVKPGLEPICFARKALAEKTIARNMASFQTGALNIDAARVPWASAADEQEAKNKNRHADFGSGARENSVYMADSRARSEHGNYDAAGRHPANVVTDGSADVFAALGEGMRVFYCAKASTEERELGQSTEDGERGNVHPTVKPAELMAWLLRLIIPPGGSVLEPFMGSGSTLIAAQRYGFAGTGIEQSQTYFDIACRRVEAALRDVRPGSAEAKGKAVEQVSLFA